MTERRPDALRIVDTATPPADASLVADFTPDLIDVGEHHLCPGCSTAFSNNLDVEVLQALHGRAPSVATGLARVRPDLAVFTIQGDGDMANEGLQELLHTAARGESIVCVMLNNGVFGETGGHLTVTTTVGQRTKNTLDGRQAERDGNPMRIADLVATIDGVAYVARGAVNNAGNVARTRRMLVEAFTAQRQKLGFAFVEILTMCPTGWFVPTADAPDYLAQTLAATHPVAVLKTAL